MQRYKKMNKFAKTVLDEIIKGRLIMVKSEKVEMIFRKAFDKAETKEMAEKVLQCAYIINLDGLYEMISDFESKYGFIIPTKLYTTLNIQP